MVIKMVTIRYTKDNMAILNGVLLVCPEGSHEGVQTFSRSWIDPR